MNHTMTDSQPMTHAELRRMVLTRLLLFIPIMGAVFFLPAGTLRYWEAWVYMAILLIPMTFVMIYLMRNDPELLERRMRMREKQKEQKTIIKVSFLWFLLAFVLPGFDHRFGWSDVPVWAVILADVLVLIGYFTFLLVMRENRYLSRIVEVAQGQQVISSGPYAVVRHPMYVGVTVMYLASPVALGSWWALLPALLIVPILVARILNEEQVLAQELPGYTEYMQKTRYRLLPGLW